MAGVQPAVTEPCRTYPGVKTFSLTREPWLPVLYSNGEQAHLGLRELFEQAPLIERLDPTHGPYHEIAMLRTLLAIVHRATQGPTSLTAWKTMRADWGTQVLEPVLAYLERWDERFWLVHPEHPFWQVTDPITGDDEANRIKGLRSLGIGDFNVWHTDAADGTQPLTLADAANRLLVAQVARPSGFTGGGIPKTHPAEDDGKGSSDRTLMGLTNVTYPVGRTLVDTLMANLAPYEYDEADQPVWERGAVACKDLRGYVAKGAKKADQAPPLLPVGRVEWLAARNRAVTLHVDEDTCLVTRANLSMGDKYDSTAPAIEALDPHMLWCHQVAEKGPAPREWISPQVIGADSPAHLSWRGNAMNVPVVHERYTGAQGRIVVTQRVPLVVAWLGTLAQAGSEVDGLRLRTVGAQLTGKATVLRTVVVDEVFLDTEHLFGPRRDRVERASSEIRAIASQLVALVVDASPDADRQYARQDEAWSVMQPLADRHLANAGRMPKPSDCVQVFRQQAVQAARQLVAQNLDGLSVSQLARATKAVRTFDKRLRAYAGPQARPEATA